MNFKIEKLPLFTLALIHLALIVPVSALAGLELTLKTDSSTHPGNNPGEFFGYPKRQKPVHDLSLQEMVAYPIKFHVMSHYQGVERVFWYKYKVVGQIATTRKTILA